MCTTLHTNSSINSTSNFNDILRQEYSKDCTSADKTLGLQWTDSNAYIYIYLVTRFNSLKPLVEYIQPQQLHFFRTAKQPMTIPF